jgi:hypothetical protein
LEAIKGSTVNNTAHIKKCKRSKEYVLVMCSLWGYATSMVCMIQLGKKRFYSALKATANIFCDK